MASNISRAIPPRVRSAGFGPSPVSVIERPRGMASYLKDVASPFIFGWRPELREPVDDTQEAWVSAASKAIDQIHNSGWIAGGTQTATAQMIGSGLDLILKPDLGVLGQGTNTEEWSNRVMRRWEAYSSDPWSVDAGGRYTLGQLAAQFVGQYFPTGEGVALLPVIPLSERPGATHVTKVSVLPSSRLSQVSATYPGAVQGVVLGRHAEPIGYIFNERDLRTSAITERLVAARDERGRPAVIHAMDGAPTATRGITPLAPVLKVTRQYDQLANATLTAALIQTIFPVSMESSAPTDEILKALQSEDEQEAETISPDTFNNYMAKRFDWYGKSKIDMGEFGRIIHTFPGETLKLHRTEHPNGNYLDFSKNLLREIARCLGITYEQLTGDYVGATYSSIRMAVADMWLINLYRRAHIAGRFYQMVFECWLEEEILTGQTPFTGGIEAYYAQRLSVTRSYWRGPPRPTADDLKTAKAQQLQRQEGWVSTEQIASEYGNDHLDVVASQAVTNQRREAAGMAALGGPIENTGQADPAEAGEAGGASARVWRDRTMALAARDRDDALVQALMRDDNEAVDALLMAEASGAE